MKKLKKRNIMDLSSDEDTKKEMKEEQNPTNLTIKTKKVRKI